MLPSMLVPNYVRASRLNLHVEQTVSHVVSEILPDLVIADAEEETQQRFQKSAYGRRAAMFYNDTVRSRLDIVEARVRVELRKFARKFDGGRYQVDGPWELVGWDETARLAAIEAGRTVGIEGVMAH